MIEDGLDERQGGLLLNTLGRLRDRQLASDKVGATNALAALGLPVAPILAEVSTPDHRIDLSAPPWLRTTSCSSNRGTVSRRTAP